MITIKVKNVEGLTLPQKKHESDAGYDVFAASEPKIEGLFDEYLAAYHSIDYIEYKTNLYIEPVWNSSRYNDQWVADNLANFVFPRSSISKYNLTFCNSVAVVDCVPPGTLISTPDGRKKVETLVNKENNIIYSFNETTKLIEEDIVTDIWSENNENFIQISTDDGYLEIPENKYVFTNIGWQKAKNLTKKQEILSVE